MTLTQTSGGALVDEQTVAVIAERVLGTLRDDLELIVAELSADTASRQLTVGQVARRLGVARSTVYAHWREWGGYKLGTGCKAPIRFDSSALPMSTRGRRKPRPLSSVEPARRRVRPQRQRPELLVDAPRLVRGLDGIGG